MTAYSGMDAMTHAVEAYCNRFRSPKMKAHAMKAVSLIGANLLTAYREPANKAARMNMLTGSYEAGIAFTNAYVGYVHAIAHGKMCIRDRYQGDRSLLTGGGEFITIIKWTWRERHGLFFHPCPFCVCGKVTAKWLSVCIR